MKRLLTAAALLICMSAGAQPIINWIEWIDNPASAADPQYIHYRRQDGMPRYTNIVFRGKKPALAQAGKALDHFSACVNTAYGYLNADDYRGFITYSDQALATGFYTAELYFYRAVAYHMLGKNGRSRYYYHKAVRNGYPPLRKGEPIAKGF